MDVKLKKILINVSCALLLSVICFGIGRASRIASSDKIIKELEDKLSYAGELASTLHNELGRRVEECEQFEKDAEKIQQGIENCKNINERMAKSIKSLNTSTNNISEIVSELRKRYGELETQNKLMSQQLNEMSN